MFEFVFSVMLVAFVNGQPTVLSTHYNYEECKMNIAEIQLQVHNIHAARQNLPASHIISRWYFLRGLKHMLNKTFSPAELGRAITPVVVNDYWNSNIRYKEDGPDDYWQTPIETLVLQTGDCEDYAIGKLFTLTELGIFNRNEVELWTVDLRGYGAHVFTVVQDKWILDNFVPNITEVKYNTRIKEVVFKSTIDDPVDPRFREVLNRMDFDEHKGYIEFVMYDVIDLSLKGMI